MILWLKWLVHSMGFVPVRFCRADQSQGLGPSCVVTLKLVFSNTFGLNSIFEKFHFCDGEKSIVFKCLA